MAAYALARKGHSITFVAWGNAIPPDWPCLLEGRVKYKYYPKRRWLSALQFLAGVMRTIVSERPDCVYVQGAQQTPFVLYRLFGIKRCGFIYHTQDYVGPGQHWFYELCERIFARNADWVISNEPNRARFMASSYRLKRMPEVIRTALPVWFPVPSRDDSFRNEMIQNSGLANVIGLKLVVAGGAYRADRMSPQLLEALAILPSNYVLVFTSCPSASSSRRLCDEQSMRLNLGERVIFWHAHDYMHLLKLLSICDIGILLYPNNGIGHFYQSPGRLTEYLRCGLPIVASQFPGLELLTMKYGLGEVADPYSPQSISKAIRRVGDLTELEFTFRRERLQKLALTNLAYEAEADPVFEKIILSIS
jgi:glycosyltransferase involved in cell wall biosynthesis